MPMAHSLLSHGLVAIMESIIEWPYDKVLQLITLFQQRPMLWDTQCEAYKDRQKRHEVTLELATRFNVEKDEIERKLKNLQSHFHREVKKEEQSKSAGSGIYRSKWFAYNAMKFLAEKSKPRRSYAQVGSKIPGKRQKPMMARVSNVRHGDKSRLKKSGHEVRNPSLRSASAIKNEENAVSAMNDFLYIDANQQNSLGNSQMDYWEEEPVNVTNQDPIEFATGSQTNEVQQQQSQHTVNFEDNQTSEKGLLTPCKNVKTLMSKDAIAPAVNFLLAELKAHGSNDPELIFYQSLIPDIMKLSDKKRRQFKEVVLCTLNKFLDEDESACAIKT